MILNQSHNRGGRIRDHQCHRRAESAAGWQAVSIIDLEETVTVHPGNILHVFVREHRVAGGSHLRFCNTTFQRRGWIQKSCYAAFRP